VAVMLGRLVTRCVGVGVLLALGCSPFEASTFVEGPVVELDEGRPTSSFEIALCSDQSSGSATVRPTLTASFEDLGMLTPPPLVEVVLERVSDGERKVSLEPGDEADLHPDDRGPWQEGRPGCGTRQRVTFELIGRPEDAARVSWSVTMVAYSASGSFEDGDLSIEIVEAP
jgi:hypothetical protein